MRRIKIYFSVFRAMFILWFLRRYTHPEFIPLTIYGYYQVFVGDVVLINNGNYSDVGEVTKVGPFENRDEAQRTVTLRLFRRPNAS